MALTELKVVTPPALELTLATVKSYLRVDFTDDDTLMTTLIQSAHWQSLWVQSSRAGINYADFWKMTPHEWSAWMEGYMLREEDAWRRTRSLYSLIYNTNVERHHQLKPEELMPLPSDKELLAKPPLTTRYLTDTERSKLKACYKLR